MENTYADYLAYFDSESDAIEFENACLSIGEYLLPDEALAVLDGKPATPLYWGWLVGQISAKQYEDTAITIER